MKAARQILLKLDSDPPPDELGLSSKNIAKWERIGLEGRLHRDDYPDELKDVVWEESVGLPKKKRIPVEDMIAYETSDDITPADGARTRIKDSPN